jgi:ABC-type lipoprotein release transport system permease subunit
MTVVTIGIAAGVLTALAVTRLMSSLLFNVNVTDAVTYVAVCALFLTVALLACFVPARRAVAVQPATVLRNE